MRKREKMKNKSVLLGIIIIVVVIFVAGCGLFYNLLLKDDFQKHFGALGYTISDKEVPLYETKSYNKSIKSK